MSKLYEDVKKQGVQIDGLQKTVTNHGTRIETLETKAKATPPTQTQAMPSEVKVVLPDDIARKSDIEEAVTKITRKCNAGERPIPQSVTVTVSALDALEKVEYDKSIRKAVKDEIQNTENTAADNNSMLKRVENKLSQADNVNAIQRKFNIALGGCIFYTVAFIIALIGFFRQDNQIEHLKRVEWLYRWSRIGKADTEEYQDFERRMLDGKKEERNGMKTKIFNMERNAPQFLYFRPVDDWTPEPPEPPKATEPEQSKSKTESKSKPLPHEQRSRLTPGEIEAIKKVRANPHIPEDAKPPLPEGY